MNISKLKKWRAKEKLSCEKVAKMFKKKTGVSVCGESIRNWEFGTEPHIKYRKPLTKFIQGLRLNGVVKKGANIVKNKLYPAVANIPVSSTTDTTAHLTAILEDSEAYLKKLADNPPKQPKVVKTVRVFGIKVLEVVAREEI